MTPTLFGRWQTRLLLLVTTLIASPLIAFLLQGTSYDQSSA